MCSDSPDSAAWFNFTYPCKRHDFGYRNSKRAESWYGTDTWRKWNKNVTDKQFRRDMLACQRRSKIDPFPPVEN